MKIRPILFNTDMVRAILDGRKNVTRRILKFPSYVQKQDSEHYTLFADGICYENQYLEQILNYLKKPYNPGDILYVRETWGTQQSDTCIGNTPGRSCTYDSCETAPGPCFDEEYIYKATDNLDSSTGKWHPSIHMPKEAARIWLRVTDVRVERLHEMKLDDFLSEGICIRMEGCRFLTPEAFNDPDNAYIQARNEFMETWNSTIPKGQQDQYGWEANPWVWVIEFEPCRKPEAAGGEIPCR